MPDLTAADLYELVKGWPDEARPGRCWWHLQWDEPQYPYLSSWATADPQHAFHITHAIALHEASGLRWLVGQGYFPEIRKADIDNWWTVFLAKYGAKTLGGRPAYSGRSLLHAIDAAIRGVG